MGKRSTQVARARGAGSRTPMLVAAAVVVLVAVVVLGGVLFTGDDGGTGGPAREIPVTPSAATYPTRVDGGVVVAGEQAPRTLEIWEDPLCPACQAFERQAGEQIARAVADGRVQVRYHLVNFLDRVSRPAGYSSTAANTMVCAAENGAFPTVHTTLYDAQPAEGAAGWTTEQLAALGPRVGAAPGFGECVTSGRHTAAFGQNLASAQTDERLTADGGFGTPTVVLDGRKVEIDSPELAGLLQ